jgi:hypothetical protein
MVAVLVGAVKIYVATMEALKKKERQGETQFPTKSDDQTQGSGFRCCTEILWTCRHLLLIFISKYCHR